MRTNAPSRTTRPAPTVPTIPLVRLRERRASGTIAPLRVQPARRIMCAPAFLPDLGTEGSNNYPERDVPAPPACFRWTPSTGPFFLTQISRGSRPAGPAGAEPLYGPSRLKGPPPRHAPTVATSQPGGWRAAKALLQTGGRMARPASQRHPVTPPSRAPHPRSVRSSPRPAPGSHERRATPVRTRRICSGGITAIAAATAASAATPTAAPATTSAR